MNSLKVLFDKTEGSGRFPTASARAWVGRQPAHGHQTTEPELPWGFWPSFKD